jgi:hypothetical protein
MDYFHVSGKRIFGFHSVLSFITLDRVSVLGLIIVAFRMVLSSEAPAIRILI